MATAGGRQKPRWDVLRRNTQRHPDYPGSCSITPTRAGSRPMPIQLQSRATDIPQPAPLSSPDDKETVPASGYRKATPGQSGLYFLPVTACRH